MRAIATLICFAISSLVSGSVNREALAPRLSRHRLCAMDALRKLVERFDKEISSRKEEIALGKAIKFWDYKAKAAYIRALTDASQWALEARDDALRPEDEL